MITIDYKDRRPIYEQIIASIENLVARGVYAENTQLPSVRQLAMELSINPNTIQRAYSELERAGVIYSTRGKGNFVSDNAGALRRGKVSEILEKMAKLAEQAISLGATKEEICAYFANITWEKGGEKND